MNYDSLCPDNLLSKWYNKMREREREVSKPIKILRRHSNVQNDGKKQAKYTELTLFA